MAHYFLSAATWLASTVKLSPEEIRKVSAIQDAVLLSNTDTLRNTWMQRRRAICAEALEEHADILYTYIATQMLERQAEFKAALNEKMKTARDEHKLFVDVFTYKHAQPRRSLQEQKFLRSAMSPEELGEDHRKVSLAFDFIAHHGLCEKMGVTKWETDEEGDLYKGNVLWPEEVHAIVRSTTLIHRLALRFGGLFCYARYEDLKQEVIAEHDIVVSTKAIRIYFKPFGLNQERLRAAIKLRDDDAAREKRCLREDKGEMLELGESACNRFCQICHPVE